MSQSVCIPRPLPGLVSEAVLVETWVDGLGVSHYMKRQSPVNPRVVALGVDVYLKMLLTDNFVHTDLHPGNIMVKAQRGPADSARSSGGEGAGGRGVEQRIREHGGVLGGAAEETGGLEQWEVELLQISEQQQNLWQKKVEGRLSRHQQEAKAAADEDVLMQQQEQELMQHDCQLSLLDFGLAEELNPKVRYHFISFLNHISAGGWVLGPAGGFPGVVYDID